jgi:aldehyde:ferredoxin oxidoreductase
LDAIGMYLFNAIAMLDQPETFQVLLDMISASYELSAATDGLTSVGKSILKNERDFNSRAAFTA